MAVRSLLLLFLFAGLWVDISGGIRSADEANIEIGEELGKAPVAGFSQELQVVEKVFRSRNTADPNFNQVQRLAALITSSTADGYRLLMEGLKNYAAGKDNPFAAFSVEATEKPQVRTAVLSLQRRYQWEQALYTGSSLRNAVARYIIEDYVTYVMRNYDKVMSQHVDAGARLDFCIVVHGLKGVVDITSSNEVGHILDKNFNWKAYDYVSEALYPQIDFGHINAGPSKFSGMELELISKAKLLRAVSRFNEKWNIIRRLLRARSYHSFIKVRRQSPVPRRRIKSKSYLKSKLGTNNAIDMAQLAKIALHNVNKVKLQKRFEGAPEDELEVRDADSSIQAVNKLMDHFSKEGGKRRSRSGSADIKLIQTIYDEVKEHYDLTEPEMAQVWDMWVKDDHVSEVDTSGGMSD